MPVFMLELKFDDKGAVTGIQRLNQISSAASSTESEISKLGQSLKNTAQNVLALVRAYKALDKIKAFAERGIAFNSSMEQSKISIGSLITSMATLEDAQGRVLTGAEKYAAAQDIAADMMKDIQRLGLETTATTIDLVEGVQGVMGSALNAGLKLQQLPEFAVAAAQAMQTLQIPLNQMRTEIDALLTGNINKSQDILAPRLDINKELIDSWKEQGILYDKLMEKLGAFKQAGKEVAQTWAGLTSNLEEALDVISGQVSTGLSDKLKETVKNLQGLFIESESKTVGISKDFQHVADVIEQVQTEIGETILSLVNSFADSVRWLNKEIRNMGGAEAALDNVKTAVLMLTAAFASLKAVRSEDVRQTARAITGEIQFARAVASGNAVILGSAEANRQKAAAAVEAARAENAAARAAEAEAAAQVRSAQANLQNAVTSRQVEQAQRKLEAANYTLAQTQERARITSAALAAAESKLGAATRIATTETTRRGAAMTAASLIWSRATALMAAGATRVATAFKALWAGLGGGVGIAITGIVTGLTYLSSRQNDTIKSTELLQRAQEAYSRATKNAVDDTDNLTRKLTELEKQQLSAANKDFAKSYRMQLKIVEDEIDNLIAKQRQATIPVGGRTIAFNVKEYIPEKYIDTLKALHEMLKNNQIDVKDFREEIANLGNTVSEAGYKNSIFVSLLEEMNKADEGILSKLEETSTAFHRSKELLDQNTSSTKQADAAKLNLADTLEALNKTQQTEIKDGKAAVEWLAKRTQGTETMTKATEENARAKDEAALKELALAEAMAQATVASAISSLALAENTEEANKAVDAAIENYNKIKTAREQYEKGLQDLYAGRKSKSGSGGTSQLESAREAIKRLKEEINKLNGAISSDGGALAKKIDEIEKMGKQAKLSAAEIRKLKDEYTAAFKADTLKEFDKAVLQIEGDASALRELEIARTLKEWMLRFAELGMSAEDAAPHLERLKNALQKQNNYNDLQTAADFYKELAKLSGEYDQSLEYRNQLIEHQIEVWSKADIPQEYLDRMRELLRLEAGTEGWDGAKRAMKSYYADATNMGKQFENFTESVLSSMEDAFVQLSTTGKLSFSDLANSMISDMVRIAYKAMVIAPIMQGITGMFGGGSVVSKALGASNAAISAIMPSAQGNVFTGGNISDYSGSIVTQPTAFSFGRHLSAFAGGGGIMGEAGPEAILPLDRGKNGRLGLAMDGMDDIMQQAQRGFAAESAKYMKFLAEQRQTMKPEVTVNVINNTGQQVQAQTTAAPDGQGGLNIEVVLDQIESGMVQRDAAGRSRFANHLDRTRGLSRAGAAYRSRRTA